MKLRAFPVSASLVIASLFAIIIGCGGGGGGGGSTNATATATTSTATTSTATTSTATTSTSTTSTSTTSTSTTSTSTTAGGTATTSSAGTTGTAGDFPPDKVIYSETSGVNENLSYMDPDGTNNVLIATLSPNFTALAPSPADNRVAFAYSSNGTTNPNYKILVNTSLSQVGAVTVDPATYIFVASMQFSQDGTKIIYVAQTSTGTSGVYVANADGTGTPVRLDEADDASLSPSGQYVVYTRFFSNGEICVKKVDNTGFVRLTSNSAEDFLPQWSKDGTKIVFSSDRTASNFNIFSMLANGTSPTQITTSTEDEYGSSFNNDATFVAFTRLSSNTSLSGVYKIAATGGSETPLLLSSAIRTPVYWTSANGQRGGFGGAASSSGGLSPREQAIIDARR